MRAYKIHTEREREGERENEGSQKGNPKHIRDIRQELKGWKKKVGYKETPPAPK